MQKASMQTYELGNLLFGHSRGKFFIDRATFQKPFENFLHAMDADVYGYPSTPVDRKQASDPTIETDVFLIRPYCWDDSDPAVDMPNFVYKPAGIQISWYKYALRDAYCSHDLTPEQFQAMLDHCLASFKGESYGTQSSALSETAAYSGIPS